MSLEEAVDGIGQLYGFFADHPEFLTDKARSLLPRPEDQEIIKKLVDKALPPDIEIHSREAIVELAGFFGSIEVSLIRNNITEKTQNDFDISDAKRNNEELQKGIRYGAASLLKAGLVIDKYNLNKPTKPFTATIENLAKKHGISCLDGPVSPRLIALLEELGTTNIEAFQVPGVLDRNIKQPESKLDIVLSKVIGKDLSLRAKSRLISEIRDALQLRPATPEMIYARLQRAHV